MIFAESDSIRLKMMAIISNTLYIDFIHFNCYPYGNFQLLFRSNPAGKTATLRGSMGKFNNQEEPK